MIQENRSFNDLFATFPNANGATSGYYLKKVGKKYVKTPIQLKETTLAALDFNHDSKAYNLDCDGQDTYPKTSCDMDGFNLEGINGNNPAGTQPYQYTNPSQIQPYWTIAQQFGLADNMFQTQGSGSFTAHQDIIAGGTALNSTASDIDYPNENTIWGCSAPAGTVTSLITTSGTYMHNGGPFPCFDYSTPTLADLLDRKGISWKCYAPPYKKATAGALWNGFAAIDEVYNGPEWKANISIPETNILTDISGGTLPGVSWVIPDQVDSDHPHTLNGQYHGPEWVASVVNAVGQSSYWNTTAIVVFWDDWGGLYDAVQPAFFDHQGGLGFRVPMLVISPFTHKGTLSHTQYETASILKFVEQIFALGSMGTNDVRATSIGDMFDFKMSRRKFQVIPSKLGRQYFLTRPPSYQPVDTE